MTHDEIPIGLRIPALQRGKHALVNPQRFARTFGVLPVKMSYDVGAIAQHDQYFGKPAVARRLHENRMEWRTNVEHANQVMLRERDAELAIYATQLVDFLGGDIGRGEDGGMTFQLLADLIELAQVVSTDLNHDSNALRTCLHQTALEKSPNRFANRSPADSEARNQIAFRYLFARSYDAG